MFGVWVLGLGFLVSSEEVDETDFNCCPPERLCTPPFPTWSMHIHIPFLSQHRLLCDSRVPDFWVLLLVNYSRQPTTGWQLTQSSGSIQTAHSDTKQCNCYAKPHPWAELPSSAMYQNYCIPFSFKYVKTAFLTPELLQTCTLLQSSVSLTKSIPITQKLTYEKKSSSSPMIYKSRLVSSFLKQNSILPGSDVTDYVTELSLQH